MNVPVTRAWQTPLQLELDRRDPAPLQVQIVRGLLASIRAGVFRPGAAIPSSRSLARTLSVHRNTVLAAYAELEAEGWIATHPQRGTFVSRDLPVRSPRSLAPAAGGPAARAGFDLPRGPEPGAPDAGPGVLQLLGGSPDPRLVSVAALARAYRRALRRTENLGYGDPQGHPRLRAALAAMLAEARGVPCAPESILVTRGAQMALALAARALLPAGAAIAVELLGYRPAWEAFRLAGAHLVPVPVDAQGLDVSDLETRIARERIRAVYLTPHHHYPTTVTLAAGRRLALLDLARRHRLLVLEDDYDAEFHYEGRPVAPLASADRDGVVVYVGTLSKVFAPGLRIGFLAAPQDVIARATAHRVFFDRQGDPAIEAAVAELFEDGDAQRHVWRTRRIYAARREALARALEARLGGALSFHMPAGGMALWCRVATGLDAEEWARCALAARVAVQAGKQFAFDGRARPYLRLGFGRHDDGELTEAVRRLAVAMPQRMPT
jgi:GntR family transcriptional regulator/MocR family aminotransferase